ncbi:DnaJ domain-containing protein [Corallococcus sp. Z5C101001]|uniref:DnaJ domain-containing protein n=1 Tax=Corallococcus sp. Z5C101001 TaxID=2596829 RepID=UPI00117F115A|nr:DnaJ domain-containing protein [Corallococcus sp. Z5C101001]TSC33595.1 molecular chaperone DnaJ [Corallococcus sp. Z5C101001]
MAEGEVRQYWVRNDRGTTWGPLTGPTIELLIDSGSIQGKLQVSTDGLQFAFPWRFPEVRDVFPRELWGDGAPASLRTAPVVPPPPGPAAPPTGPGAAPMAGPGAVPMAGPGAVPMAGPGAVPMAGPGAVPMAGPGATPMAGPGAMRSPAPVARAAVDASGRPVATRPPGPGAPARPPVAPPAAAARPEGAPATAAAPPAQAPQGPVDDGSNTVPPQGQLAQCPPMQLYGRIAAGEHTGLLTLGLSDRALSVHFRKGSPEFVDSSHAEDALGVSLLGARLLTAEQLQQAEGARERFGGDLLAALFGLGLLQPATAFAQLAQRALGILGKALRAEAGTFTFELRDLPAHKAMPLGNRWALLSDQVRRVPTADLKRRLAYVLPMPIMKSGGRVASSELRLTPHEVRALAFIDGVRSLGQLLQDVPQDAEHLLRVSFLLKELNGVSFAAATRTQAAPPPPASGPTAAARPGPEAGGAQGPGAPVRPSGTVPTVGSAAPAAGPGAVPMTPPGVSAGPGAGPATAAGASASGPGAAPRPPGATPAPTAGPGAAPRPAGSAAPTAGPGAAPRPPGAAPAAGAAPTAGPGAAPRPPGATPAPTAGPGAAPRPPGAASAAAAPRAPGAAPAAGPGAAPRPAGAPAGAAPTAGPGVAPRPPGAAPVARPAPPVVGAPAAAPAASSAAPGSDELPALRQLAVTMKGQNHFQRLGLTEQTEGSAVKIAYFRLAKLYHPDTLPQGAPPELEKLKAEVFAYVGDAYRTLTDDKSRAAYLEELKNGGGDGVDVQAILQAEELFQKSCILVKARKYPEAVKMLNEAIALNAEEPEFFAWRGYARFLAAPDKKAAQPEAFREIQAAIKRNERCAPAHYFLGVIAKLSGDAAGALKHFKRTVELQPDHIDAMREIRMASQKK